MQPCAAEELPSCTKSKKMIIQQPQPITISYNSLLQDDLSSLHDSILRAFGSGSECLGFIIVNDLPEYFPILRERALRSAAFFAQDLPEEVREKYTDPSSCYSFGWSHGKGVSMGTDKHV